jgi:hypothetical protein
MGVVVFHHREGREKTIHDKKGNQCNKPGKVEFGVVLFKPVAEYGVAEIDCQQKKIEKSVQPLTEKIGQKHESNQQNQTCSKKQVRFFKVWQFYI